jgi:hypothetical protein
MSDIPTLGSMRASQDLFLFLVHDPHQRRLDDMGHINHTLERLHMADMQRITRSVGGRHTGKDMPRQTADRLATIPQQTVDCADFFMAMIADFCFANKLQLCLVQFKRIHYVDRMG